LKWGGKFKRNKRRSKVSEGEKGKPWAKKLQAYLDTCEKNGAYPTKESAASGLGCSPGLIVSYKLLPLLYQTQKRMEPVLEKQFRVRLEQYLSTTSPPNIKRKEFYKSLGAADKTIRQKYPAFYEWATKRFEQHGEQHRMRMYLNIAEKIPGVILKLEKSGVSVTEETVSEQLGIGRKILRKVNMVTNAYEEAAAAVSLADLKTNRSANHTYDR